MRRDMRKLISAALGAILLLAAAPVRVEKLDPALVEALLKTARTYAADRTLIFYCLRKNDEMAPFLYAGVHLDIAYTFAALARLGRRRASTRRTDRSGSSQRSFRASRRRRPATKQGLRRRRGRKEPGRIEGRRRPAFPASALRAVEALNVASDAAWSGLTALLSETHDISRQQDYVA